MNMQTAQERVNALVTAMMAKGMRKPDANLWIMANAGPTVYLKWEKGVGGGGYSDNNQTEFIRGDSFAETMTKAEEFIDKQPDAQTAKLNEFLTSLGRVIDLGRQHGIEADYLNPLIASMKKLSENVITDQRGAAR